MKRNPCKLLIGVATGNATLRWETLFSLLSAIGSRVPGFEIEIIPGGGCDIAHARNLMMHYFLTRSEAEYLLFVDSDVRFGPQHIDRILTWFQNPEVRYVAGLYPLKGLALRWSYGGWAKESKIGPELWEVFEVCTGFTAMRFDLLEDLIKAYPDTEYEIEDQEYRGETAYELCAMGPVRRQWTPDRFYTRRLPEDFYLSMRIREMGVPIFVDPKIQLGHIGPFDFLNLHKKGATELAQGHV